MGTLTDTFISSFRYKRGVVFLDGWQSLKYGQAGDCDDFALTVALILSGGWLRFLFALVTFRANFWLVKSPSNGIIPRHVALYWSGRGWIDSTNREWRESATPHKPRIPLLWPWVILRIVWGALIRPIRRRL